MLRLWILETLPLPSASTATAGVRITKNTLNVHLATYQAVSAPDGVMTTIPLKALLGGRKVRFFP